MRLVNQMCSETTFYDAAWLSLMLSFVSAACRRRSQASLLMRHRYEHNETQRYAIGGSRREPWLDEVAGIQVLLEKFIGDSKVEIVFYVAFQRSYDAGDSIEIFAIFVEARKKNGMPHVEHAVRIANISLSTPSIRLR